MIRRYLKTLFLVYWYRLINKQFDSSIIPKGHYCYEPDNEKNNSRKEDDFSYI